MEDGRETEVERFKELLGVGLMADEIYTLEIARSKGQLRGPDFMQS